MQWIQNDSLADNQNFVEWSYMFIIIEHLSLATIEKIPRT